MTGAIIIVTVFYYLFSYAIKWVSQQYGIYMGDIAYIGDVAQILPALLAGICGGWQFVRTEWKPMRMGARVTCAFQSCVAIVMVPTGFMLAVGLVNMLAVGAVGIIPDITAMFTIAALSTMLMLMLYGVPAIFCGLWIGGYLNTKRARR